MRDDYQRLLDIGEGIERIERYTAGGRSEFDRNELVQTWVLHHLQIIGEAARLLSAGCKAKQPDIPWELETFSFIIISGLIRKLSGQPLKGSNCSRNDSAPPPAAQGQESPFLFPLPAHGGERVRERGVDFPNSTGLTSPDGFH